MHGRLLEIFAALLAAYGPRGWWPSDSPFEVCVGAILTQNTNWGNVERALANLKGSGVLTPEALLLVPEEQLAELIRPAGYFNLKSRRLKEFIGWLYARHGGSLEVLFAEDWQRTRRELLEVRGIGPETCDSILLYAGGKPTFVVDAYTMRLFSRLDLLAGGEGYHAVQELFMANLPADAALFNEYHALIVEHAKRYCKKRPRCAACPLSEAGHCAGLVPDSH